jgi:hypothetical protein
MTATVIPSGIAGAPRRVAILDSPLPAGQPGGVSVLAEDRGDLGGVHAVEVQVHLAGPLLVHKTLDLVGLQDVQEIVIGSPYKVRTRLTSLELPVGAGNDGKR